MGPEHPLQHVADSTHNGYLSSADWGTFNGKQGTAAATADTPNTLALRDGSGNFGTNSIFDNTSITSVDFNGRLLKSNAGTINADWHTPGKVQLGDVGLVGQHLGSYR